MGGAREAEARLLTLLPSDLQKLQRLLAVSSTITVG